MKKAIGFGLFLALFLSLVARAQAPDSGLVLHYSAQAPGQDLSGHHNHGEWHSITQGAGIPGVAAQSMAFDGSASYIQVAPSASLTDGQSITLAVWFTAQSFPSSTSKAPVFHQWFPGRNDWWELTIFFDAVFFHLTERDMGHGIAAYEFLQKNTWYHAAGVFDSPKQEMRLYLNGTLRKTVHMDLAPIISPDSPVYIGAQNFNGQVSHLFSCEMEDIRIYKRPLTDSEVLALTRGYAFSKPEAAFQKIEQLETGRYILSPIGDNLEYSGPREMVQVATEEPVWKKPWFVALSIAGAFLFSFALAALYYRQRQQEQAFEFEKRQLLERERFRVARQMHDDIGTGLSAINLLTEIALNKSKDPLLAAEIERIASTAREVNGRVQDIIWAINTQNDTLSGLLEHLLRVATDMLSPTGILLHLDAPADLPAVPLSGLRRRALFLAVKEALHNIVKHARASKVGLSFDLQGSMLHVRLSDNGRGFDPTATNDRGNGLMNMRRRMEEAGGRFHVASDADGTTVVFGLPV